MGRNGATSAGASVLGAEGASLVIVGASALYTSTVRCIVSGAEGNDASVGVAVGLSVTGGGDVNGGVCVGENAEGDGVRWIVGCEGGSLVSAGNVVRSGPASGARWTFSGADGVTVGALTVRCSVAGA